MSREYRITIEQLPTDNGNPTTDDQKPKQIYVRVVGIENEAQAIRSIDDALSQPAQVKRKRRKDAGKPRATTGSLGLE